MTFSQTEWHACFSRDAIHPQVSKNIDDCSILFGFPWQVCSCFNRWLCPFLLLPLWMSERTEMMPIFVSSVSGKHHYLSYSLSKFSQKLKVKGAHCKFLKISSQIFSNLSCVLVSLHFHCRQELRANSLFYPALLEWNTLSLKDLFKGLLGDWETPILFIYLFLMFNWNVKHLLKTFSFVSHHRTEASKIKKRHLDMDKVLSSDSKLKMASARCVPLQQHWQHNLCDVKPNKDKS